MPNLQPCMPSLQPCVPCVPGAAYTAYAAYARLAPRAAQAAVWCFIAGTSCVWGAMITFMYATQGSNPSLADRVPRTACSSHV